MVNIMDNIEEIKKRIKMKKYNNINSNRLNNKYINLLITRVLISIILLFLLLILCNKDNNIKEFIKSDVLTYNIPFNKLTNYYNKYFGSIIPIKNEGTELRTVFNEKLIYKDIKPFKDGYELSVSENYLVPVLASGIVVFIGEKEDYGKTIIIQGNDLVDYWYSNINNESVSLYDYVNKGSLLGTSNGNKLYLLFTKNNEYLGYDGIIS